MGFLRQEYWSGFPFPSPKTQITSRHKEHAIFNPIKMRKQWSQPHGQVSENARKAEHPGFRKVWIVSEPGWRRLQWETHGHAKSLLGVQMMEFLCLLEPAALTLCRFVPLGNSDSLSLLIAFPALTHNIFFFIIYFLLKDNCFTEFCCFLKASMCPSILLPLDVRLLMAPHSLCFPSKPPSFT